MSDQSIQDVTQRVYGTFEDGVTMILFVGKEKIGRLILTDHGKEIDLKEGYVYRENRFSAAKMIRVLFHNMWLTVILAGVNETPQLENCMTRTKEQAAYFDFLLQGMDWTVTAGI